MTTPLPVVDRDTMLIIRTDGSEEVVAGKPTLEALQKFVGGYIDIVRIGRLAGTDLAMAVDDDGYETELIDHGSKDGVHRFENRPARARRPVNAKATALYHAICYPGVTHQIVGDVVVFHDGDTGDG